MARTGRPKVEARMQPLSLRLAPAQLEELDALAEEMKGPNTALRITRADVVRQLIEEALQARRNRKGGF